ncbi:MAG: hypothetical protein OHK0029_10190 [Armatimonadaceae bacterium]
MRTGSLCHDFRGGATHFQKSLLPQVVSYVLEQKERHANRQLWQALEANSEDMVREQEAQYGIVDNPFLD